MNWNSWQEFFFMGGYGLYVWGAYIATFALLIAESVGLASRVRALARRLPHTAAAAVPRATNETHEA